MAFGNATKGYVKAHAGGGGGGGTKNYESLLNKPSINGVELLGDKLVGHLSGNIQVKLSDIANTNLNNVQNAQTLLYNALTQKWENGTPASGGITITLASNSFNLTDAKMIIIVGVDAYSQIFANAFPITEVTNGAKMVVGYDEQRCGYAQFSVNDGVVTWTFGGNVAPNKIYLIN